jgi:catalase
MWTDLIALPLSVFFIRTPDEMLAFLKTFRPDPAPEMPDESSLILESHPWIANAVRLAEALPAPVSFAQTAFHAFHAFRFVNAADEAQYARYHWEPRGRRCQSDT